MAFKDDVKKYVEKGVNVSKEALSKAGSAVGKFGDESILRIEKKQFESKQKQNFRMLGEEVYKILAAQDSTPVTGSEETVSAIISEIKRLEEEISRRENQLKKDSTDE